MFLALVASSCSSASERAEPSAAPTNLATTTSATTAPIPPDMSVDPLLRYAEEINDSLYEYEETFGEEIALERADCAHTAATDILGRDRLAEVGVTTNTPALDLSRLSTAERTALADALAQCPATIEMIRHLARASEPILHDCIMTKIIALDSSSKLIGDLGMNASFGETSTINGFRFSCQQKYVDNLFGEHPGGTLGEDRRLAAEALVRDMAPSEQFDTFETSCTARSVMAAMPDEWLTDFSNQPSESRVGAAEFLANFSNQDAFDLIITGLSDGAVACVRPIFTVAAVHDLQLTEAELTCLGDGELRRLWLPFMFGIPENAPPIEGVVEDVLALCGKTSP